MARIGLKLWSTNRGHIAAATALHRRGVYDYLELYVVPGSADECLEDWRQALLPVVLHAPHLHAGFNLSKAECLDTNRTMLDEVERFRRALGAREMVIHPGAEGEIDETIRQVAVLRQEYKELFAGALLENKPRVGLEGQRLLGAAPEEIGRAVKATGLGFCLDIGHGACYAAWAGKTLDEVWADFLSLGPAMFHLSDGDPRSVSDSHQNLGAGRFDLPRIIGRIPPEAVVCLETKKSSQTKLADFERDVAFFRRYAR